MKKKDSNSVQGTPSVSVYFGRRQSLERIAPENSIVVMPSDGRWNDFGLHTRADFSIRLEDFSRFSASGFIGFIDDDQKSDPLSLSRIVESNPSVALQPAKGYKFFSMLSDMEEYRQIVRTFGVDTSCQLLLSVNDIVALRLFDPTSHVLQEATRTEAFSRSFVRNSDSYFAYKNASSILRGLSDENIGVLASSLSIRFQMRGRPNEHELKFNFDHDGILPKRISIVIGKNGVGKSQTLAQIARSGLDGSKKLTEGSDGQRPVINRILAFAPTSERDSAFPQAPKLRSRIWYRTYSLNRTPRTKKPDGVSELLVELARSPQSIGGNFRWDIFMDAIKCIASPRDIHLITTGPSNGATAPKTVALSDLDRGPEQKKLDRFASIDPRKDPVRVVDGRAFALSSGEISFLKFAAQASLDIENGSLLLLDEPETHLHPNFISQFVSLLNILLEMTGSAAIIATHSAYFVREVFREQVTVLGIDSDGFVQAARPVLRTFGADVGAISYFVFGEDELSGLGAGVVHRLVASGMTWDEVYDTYKDELSLELLNEVRSQIELGASN